MTHTAAFVLLFGALAVRLPAFGDEYVKPQPEVTRTEHVDFASGGVIRLDGAYGDLFVEGRDQAQVETSVTKSMRYKYESAQSQQAAQHLAVATRWYWTGHLFLRPAFDLHHVNNLSEFGSTWVPQYSVGIGYSLGRGE